MDGVHVRTCTWYFPIPSPSHIPVLWGTICLLLRTDFAPPHEVQGLSVPTCLQKKRRPCTQLWGRPKGPRVVGPHFPLTLNPFCLSHPRACVFVNVRLSGLYLLEVRVLYCYWGSSGDHFYASLVGYPDSLVLPLGPKVPGIIPHSAGRFPLNSPGYC